MKPNLWLKKSLPEYLPLIFSYIVIKGGDLYINKYRTCQFSLIVFKLTKVPPFDHRTPENEPPRFHLTEHGNNSFYILPLTPPLFLSFSTYYYVTTQCHWN